MARWLPDTSHGGSPRIGCVKEGLNSLHDLRGVFDLLRLALFVGNQIPDCSTKLRSMQDVHEDMEVRTIKVELAKQVFLVIVRFFAE